MMDNSFRTPEADFDSLSSKKWLAASPNQWFHLISNSYHCSFILTSFLEYNYQCDMIFFLVKTTQFYLSAYSLA